MKNDLFAKGWLLFLASTAGHVFTVLPAQASVDAQKPSVSFSPGTTAMLLEKYSQATLTIATSKPERKTVFAASWYLPGSKRGFESQNPIVAEQSYSLPVSLSEITNFDLQLVSASGGSLVQCSNLTSSDTTNSLELHCNDQSQTSITLDLESSEDKTLARNWSKEWRLQADFGYLFLSSQESNQRKAEVFVTKNVGIERDTFDFSLAIVNSSALANTFSLRANLTDEELSSLFSGESLQKSATHYPQNSSKQENSALTKEVTASIRLDLSHTQKTLKCEKSELVSILVDFERDGRTSHWRFPVHQSANCQKSTVSIGSYNIENLWDADSKNSNPYNDYSTSQSNWYSHSMYRIKGKTTARAIAIAGSPDVLAVQELESAKNESKSFDLIKVDLAKLGYKYFALGKQDQDFPVAVTVGIISKYPIVENTSLRYDLYQSGGSSNAQPSGSARNPQKATIALSPDPEHQITLYNNHWKSLRGGPQFARQAHLKVGEVIANDISASLAQSEHFHPIILGDLNSGHKYLYECTEGRSSPDCQVKTAIRDVLQVNGDKEEVIEESSGRSASLYNLWFEYKESHRCHYYHHADPQCFDNIYLHHSLLGKSDISYKDVSFRAVGISGGVSEMHFLGANGKPFRWQRLSKGPKHDRYTQHLGVGYSDHLPVVADLELSKALVGKEHSLLPEVKIRPSSSSYYRNCDAEGYQTVDLADINRLKELSGKCVLIDGLNGAPVKFHRGGRAIKVRGKWVYVRFAGNPEGKAGSQSQQVSRSNGDVKIYKMKGRLGWDFGTVGLFWFDVNDLVLKR